MLVNSDEDDLGRIVKNGYQVPNEQMSNKEREILHELFGWPFNHRARQRNKVFKLNSQFIKLQDHKCNKCGGEICKENSEVDHIIPIASGGNNDRLNLQSLCKLCNAEKSDNIPEENTLKQVNFEKLRNNKIDLIGFTPDEEKTLKQEDIFKIKSDSTDDESKYFISYPMKDYEHFNLDIKNEFHQNYYYKKQVNLISIFDRTDEKGELQKIEKYSFITYSKDGENYRNKDGYWNVIPVYKSKLFKNNSCEDELSRNNYCVDEIFKKIINVSNNN